jgi:hypothetical protein
MRNVIAVLCAAIAAAVVLPSSAQTSTAVVGTAPGFAAGGETVNITAKITAIDSSTRAVTLKGPQGNEVTVKAGPEVKNFAQMKVGDDVNVQYIEALTLELKKGGGQAVSRTEQVGSMKAKPGERPAGAVGTQVTIVADVVNVDTQNQRVTLRGPQRTVDLKVKDPKQLAMIAKGDQVEAVYTEAVALSVAPAPQK